MTISRRYGEDTPFGTWLRKQTKLDSHQHSFTANDVDFIFHKYRANVKDEVGSRELQTMIFVEVKTNNAKPNKSQAETLFFVHQLIQSRERKLKTIAGTLISVWCDGVFVLSMPGNEPSWKMGWGTFTPSGQLEYKNINEETLIGVIGGELDPHTLAIFNFRRHHKKKTIEVMETTELGFQTIRTITKSS